MADMSTEDIVAALSALGVSNTAAAQRVASISNTPEQALSHLGRISVGEESPRAPWRELFSEEGQRYYYADTGSSETSWLAPPHFKFGEWGLDAATYQIPLAAAKRLYDAVDAVMGEERAPAWKPVMQMLIKVIGNVVDSSNTVEKYRRLRISSGSRFLGAAWAKPGGRQVMEAAGFRVQGDSVCIAPDADLAPATALLARLRRLVDDRGHSGAAEFFPLPATTEATGTQSPFLNTAGFRYQTVIHHCSLCDHPINDGSERLFTGLHDSPKGEFRYECTSCEGVNLCEKCWDERQAGDAGHDPSHVFHAHHVRTQRHNTGDGAPSAGSPWGMLNVGGSANRARERLRERYGV